MNVDWRRFTKVEPVEAVQLTEDVIREVASHPELGMFHLGVTAEHDVGLSIDTKEGRMRAEPGDYLCRGVDGEFWPVSEDIFERTYEEIEE